MILAEQIKEIVNFFYQYGKYLLFMLIIFGMGLHFYESFVLSNGGAIFFFLWGITPYLLCLGVSYLFKKYQNLLFPTLIGMLITVWLDLMCHMEVFVHPSSSTSALLLIFMPIWNIVFIAGSFIFFIISNEIIHLFKKRKKHS